jgi:hypothetical protein
MDDQPKITLRSFRPLWEGWIKGIIKEVDQALQLQPNLSQSTRAATDNLEFTVWKVFSHYVWKIVLLNRLETLGDALQEESKVEVQRALNLTQGLIREIKEEG